MVASIIVKHPQIQDLFVFPQTIGTLGLSGINKIERLHHHSYHYSSTLTLLNPSILYRARYSISLNTSQNILTGQSGWSITPRSSFYLQPYPPQKTAQVNFIIYIYTSRFHFHNHLVTIRSRSLNPLLLIRILHANHITRITCHRRLLHPDLPKRST